MHATYTFAHLSSPLTLYFISPLLSLVLSGPTAVLTLSLMFIGSVILLHIYGKVKKAVF
jgi:hypothetical protein